MTTRKVSVFWVVRGVNPRSPRGGPSRRPDRGDGPFGGGGSASSSSYTPSWLRNEAPIPRMRSDADDPLLRSAGPTTGSPPRQPSTVPIRVPTPTPSVRTNAPSTTTSLFAEPGSSPPVIPGRPLPAEVSGPSNTPYSRASDFDLFTDPQLRSAYQPYRPGPEGNPAAGLMPPYGPGPYIGEQQGLRSAMRAPAPNVHFNEEAKLSRSRDDEKLRGEAQAGAEPGPRDAK
ncbi:hypothetical protein BAUCODRAFT_31457 [Baudoinia panamericana UAMH 10762]|uniref:Uncharacterized protein n=1 Tax=Baudoinia panamericana (strain UAMH 10762) TaxID=717646 RepID=M2N554_BAUPA|nr:uncharacterized protein BAUCODRAFT_31457 [Baudoinia panamericana UAMH 10762]EMC99143.1 hypothetical protein BAUCODRAFT_31457 [Baudoinia panamericana UAMH 10762]